MSDNALFGNYVEMRAWRAAFAAMLEEENSEELEDKIPWHVRLKDEQRIATSARKGLNDK